MLINIRQGRGRVRTRFEVITVTKPILYEYNPNQLLGKSFSIAFCTQLIPKTGINDHTN